MYKMRKLLSVIMVVLILITAAFSVSITSSASYDIDKTVVFEFSEANHNYSKTEGCNPNANWAWGTFATTSLIHSSNGSVLMGATAGSYDKFRQYNSNWKNVTATTETAYVDIANYSDRAIKVKFVNAGTAIFDDSSLPSVAVGETKTIELGTLTAGSLQVVLMDNGGSDSITCSDTLFEVSPIYLDSDSSIEPEETTVPVLDSDAVYPFVEANHNWSKTEGCNPNANWAWGTFATTSFTYNSNGSIDVNTTADSYEKFRQLQTNWNNVPATTETVYIDITNNSNKVVKVKVQVGGYTTPADADLPLVRIGETTTIELGVLTGGTLKVYFLDYNGADDISCGEAIFNISGIYEKPSSTEPSSEESSSTEPSSEESSSTEPSSEESSSTEPSSEESSSTEPSSEESSSTEPSSEESSSTEPTSATTSSTPTQPTKPICVHTTVLKNFKSETYFAEGYSGDTYCVKCNQIVTKGTKVAKLVLKTPKLKAKAVNKKFRIKYKKVDGATGFQVRYKIKGKWKIKTFKAKKNVTRFIKKVNVGKRYKVQVRAMVKQGKLKAFSKWSKVKKVTIK